MTFGELHAVLKATGHPVAYSHFTATPTNPAPKPPFITYLDAFSSNFKADNKVHTRIRNVQIELYTEIKDLTAEKKLEDLLNENELAFDDTETWIESENLFQKIYEVRLI